MPELPEVETIRAMLEPELVGRRIVSARLMRRDVLIMPGDPPGGFSRARRGARPAAHSNRDLLEGATIASLRRRGKQMAIVARDGRVLVVQLGMSGQVLLDRSESASALSHVHASWCIQRAGRLLFRDPRRFGSLRTFQSETDLADHWAALGPDALAITADDLGRAIRSSERPIKAALLDQSVLAGVGNIYADESLFASGIHPLARCRSITDGQVHSLAAAIRVVLSAAVASRGSTLRDYRDAGGEAGSAQDSIRVYGRGGSPCPQCGTALRAITVAQRTTTFCPVCQEQGPSSRRRKERSSRRQN